MKKIMFIAVFISVNLLAEESDNKVIYQCPWPDPEFSILTVRPTNLLRIVARPRHPNTSVSTHYVDVPFSWMVVDSDNEDCLNLTMFGKEGIQVDWTDTQKRPMRYTYRYLYMCTFGLLLASSDGKPLPLETSVTIAGDVDPVSQKEGDFVVAYDHKQNKKLYESHLLVPTRTLDEPQLDEVPFVVDYPRIAVDKNNGTIACVYPEQKHNNVATTKDKEVTFTGKLPQSVDVHGITIVRGIRAECCS
jgi:hypothetical protein